MNAHRFVYQSEKLAAARQCLMLPHPKGEADSIACAFSECSLAFRNFDVQAVQSDDARKCIETIQQMMNTTGINDPEGRGKYFIKAEQLSVTERSELSIAVDELAYWFRREFEGER